MPTTTWAVAAVDLMRPLGLVEAATTTNITTSAVVVSTSLADDYPVNDTFNGWYCEILNDADGSTSTNLGTVRRVTDYVGSSGTITIAGANFSAEDESVNFKLTRFHPNRVQEHFNRARQHPELRFIAAIVRDIETTLTGQNQVSYTLPTTIREKPIAVYKRRRLEATELAENEITDPSFEDWSSATALSSWTLSGTGASVNQEEETSSPKNYQVLAGGNSARVLSNSSDETTLLQTVTPSVGTQRVEANFSVWVYNIQTALSVTARCAGTDSSAHGGTGWEKLTVAVSVAEATTVAVGVAVATGTAFSIYVDEAILVLGQSELIEAPWEPVLRWDWTPPASGAATGGTLDFSYRLDEKVQLRILARDMLSSVSALTDTIELDGMRLEALYDKTRELICEQAAITGPIDQREFWIGLQRHWNTKFQQDTAGLLPSTPNPKVKIPDWVT